LSVVNPGDFEAGIFVIYHASSRTALEAGNCVAIPVSQILISDYVGDGKVGSVTFWTSSLSVFGIGSGGGGTSLTGGGGSGGCFIATAAFGSYFNPYVKILRDFRYIFLMTSELGKAFVGWYYWVSPPIADAIRTRSFIKAVVRMALRPIVGISYLSLTIGVVPALLMLLFLAAVAFLGIQRLYRHSRQFLR